jgi:hypothetical protein
MEERMKPGPSPEIIQRIEGIDGRPAAEVVHRLYLEEQFSYRQLCARWRLNTRTLMRLLEHFQITPRKGGDAVRAQWVHAPEERRHATSKRMRCMVREMLRQGKHPRLGKTKETDRGARTTSEKLKHATSARRPEVRERNAAAHRLVVRRDPQAHATTKRSPTLAEAMMLTHLHRLGLKPIYNHIVLTSVGPKWINVYVPRLNLGIECEHQSRFPLDWERHCVVSALGIRVVYITNKRIMRERFGGLDEYISRLQAIRPHPTAHGQNTVIWGRIDPAVFKDQPDQVAVETVAVDGGHTLLLTTAPEDPVVDGYGFNRSPAAGR